GDQPSPLHPVDSHHAVPAANFGHRHFRHEHQGPSLHRERGCVLSRGRAHDRFGARRLSDHAPDRGVQVLKVARTEPVPRVVCMRLPIIVTACIAVVAATTSALAAAKDESAAEWLPLIPKWFTDWRNGLADQGLSFGATYIADDIANVSGGMKRGAIHF